MKFIFSCTHCRLEEAKRCKALDDIANEGKRVFGKQKTKMNPDNFMREASIVVMEKNSQLEYGTVYGKTKFDHEYESTAGSQKDGWSLTCSVCNKVSGFSRGLGNL